jgi:hypothetical protein
VTLEVDSHLQGLRSVSRNRAAGDLGSPHHKQCQREYRGADKPEKHEPLLTDVHVQLVLMPHLPVKLAARSTTKLF